MELQLNQENMNALLHFMEQFIQHHDTAICEHVEDFSRRDDVEAFLTVDKLFFNGENSRAYLEDNFWGEK